MTKQIIKKINALMAKPGKVLITAHRDPDGDSIGCQLAFYEFLRKRRGGLVVAHDGELPQKYRFLDPRGVIKQPDQIRSADWAAAIIFECSTLDRVGRIREKLGENTPIINIDHHTGNRKFGSVDWIDRHASACGEMVHKLIREMGGTITRRIASLLLTTILTDTGRFHYKSTKPATMRVVADLMESGANLKQLTDRLYCSYSEAQFRYINYVLAQADIRDNGHICFLKVRRRDLKRFGVFYRDLEGLVDCTLTLSSVKIGALLREMEGGWTKISLRSTGRLSIVPLAHTLEGGGHPNAAGCHLDLPLNEAVEKLATISRRYLRDRI